MARREDPARRCLALNRQGAAQHYRTVAATGGGEAALYNMAAEVLELGDGSLPQWFLVDGYSEDDIHVVLRLCREAWKYSYFMCWEPDGVFQNAHHERPFDVMIIQEHPMGYSYRARE